MIVRNVADRAAYSPEKMGKVTLAGADRLHAGLNCFLPGQEHKAHVHADQDKLYYVVDGDGEATVGAESGAVTAGDLVLAPAGVPHSMKNAGDAPLLVLVIFSPPPR